MANGGWNTYGTTAPAWLQIDLGAGNGVAAPNSVRVKHYDAAHFWKDWRLDASNTGAFSGEEVTLITVHETEVHFTPHPNNDWSVYSF